MCKLQAKGPVAFCIVTGSQCYCIDGISEKTISFACFYWRIVTDVAAWILWGDRRKDLTETHVAHWLSVLPYMVLACLSNLGMGISLILQNSCCPLLNLCHFELISKNPDKSNPTLSDYHAHKVSWPIIDLSGLGFCIL